MGRALTLVLVSVLGGLLCVGAASGRAFAGPVGEVSLQADRLEFDRAAGIYRARGDVVVSQDGLELEAQSLEFDAASGQAAASGGVRLLESSGQGELQGAKLQVHLPSGRGRLLEGRAFFAEPNFHLAGDVIERLADQRYRISNGSFTTCDGEVPSWKFTARQLNVSVDGYASARHATFYLHDLPVFYLPYLIYPVKTERQSGFLTPRLGYSQRRGAQLFLSWYQVIDRHLDATLYLDYLSRLGLGKGLEYRYLVGESSSGTLHGYHVSGFHQGQTRYALGWSHRGVLPGQVRLTAETEYLSSRDYLDDFGELAGEYNRDLSESVVALARNWGKLNLSGQVKHLRDLDQSDDQTLQQLPEMHLEQIPVRVAGTPLFFGLQGRFANLWRTQGEKGRRLSLRPALSLPVRAGAGLEVEPSIAYLQRFYDVSDAGSSDQGLYEASVRLGGRLQRLFSLEGSSPARLRHSIEPELIYRYRPHEEQGTLPLFDGQDRLGALNRFDLSLTNRLVARYEQHGRRDYRELGYLRLSGGYDLRLGRHGRDRLSGEGPWLDIRSELVVRPTPEHLLDLDLNYDPHRRVLKTAHLALGLDASQANAATFGYSYVRDDHDYLSAQLNLALLDPFFIQYEYRHDFLEGRSLENVFELEYRSQCWSLYLTARDRLGDQEFLVNFALTGLGKNPRQGTRFSASRD